MLSWQGRSRDPIGRSVREVSFLESRTLLHACHVDRTGGMFGCETFEGTDWDSCICPGSDCLIVLPLKELK